MNGKQAKRLRAAARHVFVEKLEDCVALSQTTGVPVHELAAKVPPPHRIYRRAKRELKRGAG